MNPRRNLQTRKNRRKRNERWARKPIRLGKRIRIQTVLGWCILNKEAKVLIHAE